MGQSFIVKYGLALVYIYAHSHTLKNECPSIYQVPTSQSFNEKDYSGPIAAELWVRVLLSDMM